MGTHPIFESDFDCLTDGGRRQGRLAQRAVSHVTSDHAVRCAINGQLERDDVDWFRRRAAFYPSEQAFGKPFSLISG